MFELLARRSRSFTTLHPLIYIGYHVDLKLCELQLGKPSNKDVREPFAGTFGRKEVLLPLNDDGGSWCRQGDRPLPRTVACRPPAPFSPYPDLLVTQFTILSRTSVAISDILPLLVAHIARLDGMQR